MNSLINLYSKLTQLLTTFLEPISLLCLRLVGAKIFLQSGLTKWNGFLDFNTEKYDLFLYEFFCPGSWTVFIIEKMAYMAGIMEIVLPALLIVGLFTRLGALGLLGMTLFIQLAVFPTWDHWWNPAVWWAIVMLALVARGPGLLSIDRLIGLEKK